MEKAVNTGVTLPELLLVIGIVSILVGYAVISFSSIAERQQLKSAGETIFSDLRLAQSEAIKRNKTVYVNFKTFNNSWCYGINVGAECDCSQPNKCKVDNIQKVINGQKFKGISLQKARFAGNKGYTAFNPVNGFAKASGVKNGSIWLSSKNGTQLAIIVNRLGRIRFCSPTISEYSKVCPTPP